LISTAAAIKHKANFLLVGAMTDIARELEVLEKRLNELDNDPIMRLVHVNYMAMLEQAKTKAKSDAAAKKRWFVCDEELL
jgi:hypothetical protein